MVAGSADQTYILSMAARSSFSAPKLTPGAMWLLIVHLTLFIVWVMGGQALQGQMAHWLVLTPGSLLDGHVWKLATGPLFTTSGFDVFFDSLMLWLFIPTLERFWGTRRFVWFFIWTALVGSVAGVLVGLALGQTGAPIMGLSPFVFACIAAYGVVFYGQEVRMFGVLPLKAHVFAIGLAAILAITTLLNARWVSGRVPWWRRAQRIASSAVSPRHNMPRSRPLACHCLAATRSCSTNAASSWVSSSQRRRVGHEWISDSWTISTVEPWAEPSLAVCETSRRAVTR